MSFSKVKDVDRLILQKLEDQDLFNTLLTNKYANSLADENFWMNRVLIRYPGTFQFKEPNPTWRNFYLSSVYYIDKMLSDFGFSFTKGDPKKYYHALRINDNALWRSGQAKFLRNDMEDVALYYNNKLRTRIKRYGNPVYQLNTPEWEKEKEDLLYRYSGK